MNEEEKPFQLNGSLPKKIIVVPGKIIKYCNLMNSIHIEIIGLLAASFTTFAFVPQVFKIWKNKNAEGVSVSMYVIMLVGICIWLYYGF